MDVDLTFVVNNQILANLLVSGIDKFYVCSLGFVMVTTTKHGYMKYAKYTLRYNT